MELLSRCISISYTLICLLFSSCCSSYQVLKNLTWNAYICSSCLHVLLQYIWICPSKLRTPRSRYSGIMINLGAQILSCVLFCLTFLFQVWQAPLICDWNCKACFWVFYHLVARLLHLARTWGLWEGMVPEQRTKQCFNQYCSSITASK